MVGSNSTYASKSGTHKAIHWKHHIVGWLPSLASRLGRSSTFKRLCHEPMLEGPPLQARMNDFNEDSVPAVPVLFAIGSPN